MLRTAGGDRFEPAMRALFAAFKRGGNGASRVLHVVTEFGGECNVVRVDSLVSDHFGLALLEGTRGSTSKDRTGNSRSSRLRSYPLYMAVRFLPKGRRRLVHASPIARSNSFTYANESRLSAVASWGFSGGVTDATTISVVAPSRSTDWGLEQMLHSGGLRPVTRMHSRSDQGLDGRDCSYLACTMCPLLGSEPGARCARIRKASGLPRPWG